MDKKKTVYDGKILSLSLHTVNVDKKRTVTREIVNHNGAAAVLAFDDKGRVILVKQHRYPYGYALEIPAGTLEKGEKPRQCAIRELKEETGYLAKKVTPLIKFYPSIGYNTEVIHCFIASNVHDTGVKNQEDDEKISIKKIEFDKLLKMIVDRKIVDSKTICAALTYSVKNREKS